MAPTITPIRCTLTSSTVDATPGTGDLFYNGLWHTWLYGGLGAGGNAIYALDITNPASSPTARPPPPPAPFAEQRRQHCDRRMVELRRSHPKLHDQHGRDHLHEPVDRCRRQHGVHQRTRPAMRASARPLETANPPLPQRAMGGGIGDRMGSYNGDAGIFIMLVTSTSGTSPPIISFYYLSTGYGNATSLPNGIAYRRRPISTTTASPITSMPATCWAIFGASISPARILGVGRSRRSAVSRPPSIACKPARRVMEMYRSRAS